jgi:hypothetical protein
LKNISPCQIITIERRNLEKTLSDMHSGKVVYAVLFFGGFLGMGQKLFAVPWGMAPRSPINFSKRSRNWRVLRGPSGFRWKWLGRFHGAGGCIYLRIARVTIPEYLNRPDIVTRTTENIMTLSDDDQWAEPGIFPSVEKVEALGIRKWEHL